MRLLRGTAGSTRALAATFAMPKSSTFTPPEASSMMFEGVTSRWTIFAGRPSGSGAPCAWSRPSATSAATCAATPGGTAARRSRHARMTTERSRPRRYSMAMKYAPPICPKSYISTMFGWLSSAQMRASLQNSSTSSAESAFSGRMRLMTNVSRNPSNPST